jgi:SPP1 family predicted phage head-tail adaptor
MGLMMGRLSSRIRIEQRGTTQDDWGQPQEVWSEVATVWADFRHLSGMESARGGAEISEARASVRIRWRNGVTPAMRVLETYSGKVYDIKAVLPDMQRREFVDLVCEAAA